MPVNYGHFNFKQIKILAGQRSIYLKLKDWIYSLINEPNSDDDAGKNSDVVRAVARALIGGGGCIFIYSCYDQLISFEIGCH